MCTVTWLRDDDGFELLCNRDERRTRPPAEPPRLLDRGGVPFVAPTDPEGGGTWIAVSGRGLALCLLNAYCIPSDSKAEGGDFVSRGVLVTDLVDAGHPEEVVSRVGAIGLTAYRSFRLLALAPGHASLLVSWDGQSMAVDRNADSHMPLISSAKDPERAAVLRRGEMDRLAAEHGGLNAAALETLHRSHAPERGPDSVCMHREEAATQSLSHVRVTAQAVEFRYVHGAPCTGTELEPVELVRAR